MTRLLWAALAFAATAVLVTARLLEPAASGHGTHVALGLPPCGFLSWTGMPCPTCGLTTALAQLLRGEVQASLRAHVLGVPVLLALLASILTAAQASACSESLPAAIERTRADRWASLLATALLIAWLARLLALR